MNQESWVEAHRYLEGIARFESLVADALDSASFTDLDSGVDALVVTLSKLDLPAEVAAGIVDEDSALRRLLACHVLRRLNATATPAASPDAVCPTCDSSASLAVLTETEDGRQRYLACTCCHTTWPYKRVGCPYCGDESPQTVLEVEGEQDVRIDLCDDCQSYVKTYTGDAGGLPRFLADWPTLHLDAIAGERGYRRLGATLYDF